MGDDLPVRSGSASLVDRAKAIITQPKAEWPRIAAETTEPTKVLTGYVVPLALIGPIASLIGMQIFGINAVIATIRPSLTSSLAMAVTSFVMTIVGVFVLAFIANWLSPKFGGRDSFPAAFRLVAYAMTAAWVGGIFGLIPALWIIGLLFGLYTLYLLYLGASPVMGVPQDKAAGYTAVTILAAIVLYILVGVVTASVTGAMGVGAGALAAQDAETTVNLGEYGTMTIDTGDETIEIGDSRIEVDGDTARVTIDGREVEIDVERARAAAEAAAVAAAAQTPE